MWFSFFGCAPPGPAFCGLGWSPVARLGSAHPGSTWVPFWVTHPFFFPGRRGLTPLGVFPFRVVMSGRRAFPCTVTLNVRELASGGLSRQDVVSAIIDTFQPARPIAAVQFLGYEAKVTFEQMAHKREVMACEHIRIKDVDCPVRGGGPRPQNVLIYNFPYEIPHEVVRDSLSHYGDVESVLFRHWTHVHVCDGVRTVRMVRARAIPRNLTIDGFHVKVSYPGQAPECDICYDLGHIAKNCPLRGKCLECRQSGHLRRDCPVRLRRLALSEDSVANLRAAPPGSDIQDANSALDFDALSGVEPVANVSGSVSTDSLVDLRDNQLDEITSQSVLADAIPACTSATVPDQIDSVQPKLPIVSGSSSGQIPNSAVQIPNSTAAAAAATPGVQPAIVVETDICNDVSDNDDITEFTSESSNEINVESSNNDTSESNNNLVVENANTVISGNTKENVSVSLTKVISDAVNDNTSESINSSQIVSNVVSPGSSLDPAQIAGLEGVAQALRPLVSNPVGRGVQKPTPARQTGLRPGLRQTIRDWTKMARRKR